jgi:hypothetical protein
MVAVQTYTIHACALRADQDIRHIRIGPGAADDRLAIALFLQPGLDVQRWPATGRRALTFN